MFTNDNSYVNFALYDWKRIKVYKEMYRLSIIKFEACSKNYAGELNDNWVKKNNDFEKKKKNTHSWVTVHVIFSVWLNKFTVAISVTTESSAWNFLEHDFLDPPISILPATACENISSQLLVMIPSNLYSSVKKA